MILYSSCNFEHCVETGMSSKKWLHFWVKIPKLTIFDQTVMKNKNLEVHNQTMGCPKHINGIVCNFKQNK